MFFDSRCRSTQPCIPPGSLNRVPASAGVRAGMLPGSAGWQVTLCDPVAVRQCYIANCYIRRPIGLYFTIPVGLLYITLESRATIGN